MLIITIFSVLYYTLMLTNVIQNIPMVELVIWVIYVRYYITRLYKSSNRLSFIKSQWLDIPILIPIFMLGSSDGYDFIRFVILVTILFDYLIDWLEDSLLTKPLLMVSITYTLVVVTSTIGFMRFEGLSFTDSMWLSFISSTTVGYGDISATTPYGMMITVYIVISGTILLGSVLISIVMKLIDDRRNKMIEDIESKESNIEDIGYVKLLFQEFKNGDINLNELENKVIKEIEKEDK